MDGFAGFPIQSSTPRGSAFVEFTRGERTAPPPEKTPAPSTRQNSLAVLRGGERVSAADHVSGNHTSVPDRPPAALKPRGLEALQIARVTGDLINRDGTLRPTK